MWPLKKGGLAGYRPAVTAPVCKSIMPAVAENTRRNLKCQKNKIITVSELMDVEHARNKTSLRKDLR